MSAEPAAEKRDMRIRMRRLRRERTEQWVQEASESVQRRAMELPEWAAASVVCLYLAMPGEVRTSRMLREGVQAGKRVCVPAFRPSRGDYGFVRYVPGMALDAGPMQVPQPRDKEWVPWTEPDCVFVPGLAFDRQGGRLGHGGGYYDRILACMAGIADRVGLAFSFQVRELVPRMGHDARMQVVVTETETIRCAV